MTEETDKQTESKDSGEHHAASKKAKRHRRRKHRPGVTLLILLLVMIALVGAGGWYGYQRVVAYIDKAVSTEAKQYENITSKVEELRSALDSAQKSNHAELDKLNRAHSELENTVIQLRDKNQHLRKDWLLLEAEYLIQIANYRLLFERDVKTAIVALETADTRLGETGDPSIVKVRRVITEDIQSLRKVEQPDLSGMSLTLTTLGRDIDNLPRLIPDPDMVSKERRHQKEGKRANSWSELPGVMWDDLMSLVEIRDYAQPIGPLLAPEELLFLRENLRLQLEQARLAMLAGHQAVYRERLETAINWIKQYFDVEAAETRAMLAALEKLAATPITPTLPDISGTYEVLQKYRMQDREQP
jgi:uroporphyrin-3 C-methyltransferase